MTPTQNFHYLSTFGGLVPPSSGIIHNQVKSRIYAGYKGRQQQALLKVVCHNNMYEYVKYTEENVP
jgi:hypothetical protein